MNKEEIDKWLHDEEGMSYTELEKLLERVDNRKDKLQDKVKELQQENKQLKEQLENDIDRYEDTISYQLGFDKGKEYLQQIIDNAIEYIKNILKWVRLQKDWETEKILLNLLILLGDKE